MLSEQAGDKCVRRRAALPIVCAASFCVVMGSARGSSPDVISTYAGGGPNNVAATAANIDRPVNAALDTAGNYYIVTQYGLFENRILKVNSSATLTVAAGDGFSNYYGDGGAAVNAEFLNPQAVAIDKSGNIYIADSYSCVIRKVTASTGIVSVFAGNNNSGCGNGGDGGAATSAELNGPAGVALDASGNVYIADTGNQRIRKVTASSGVITTVAGNGTQGFAGDGGAAIGAELNNPSSVAVDGSANIYIADNDNYRVRKVAASSGAIFTIAGNGTPGDSGDGGAGTSAEINNVFGIAVDSSGKAFIADAYNCVIRQVSTSDVITRVAGESGTCGFSGDGADATSAELGEPEGVAVDNSDNLYIADTDNWRIRKLTASTGVITTIAGNGTLYYAAASTALGTTLNGPTSAVPDTSGNLYVADQQNCIVRKVSSTGAISTIAGVPPGASGANCAYSGDGGAATSAHLNLPTKAVADASGNVYIADTENCSIRKVTASTGAITTIAGKSGVCGYSGDGGVATSAELSYPNGLALDTSSNLYIADTGNNIIRKVTVSTSVITTIAGNKSKGAGFAGDGGAATSALLNQPYDVALDSYGNLYIADCYNSRIRKVETNGTIATFAGNGTAGYGSDGVPASSTSLYYPTGVAVDVANDVLIADRDDNRIRWVDGADIIYTIAGGTNFSFLGDGNLAINADVASPWNTGVDSAGNIYVADDYNYRVRKVASVPNVNASEYSLTFPAQNVGSASTAQNITLLGVGSSTISSFSVSGPFAQTNNCSSTLASGASCTVNVTFKPAGSGTQTGTLTVATNSFLAPNISVTLSGTGTGSSLSYSPTSLALGHWLVGTTSSTQYVTFTNNGSSGINFSGASTTSSLFKVPSNTCTGTLASGKTCTIGVNFTPNASGYTVGAYLDVTDSGPSSPQQIAIRGTGVGTSLSPTSLSYGTVSKGSTKALTTTLTNKGTATITSIQASVTGSNASDFSFTTTCGSSLAVGMSCVYSITFKPSTTGAESGSLYLTDNEYGFFVTLSGTGH